MHLFIFCGLRTVRSALSVYLHHLCLIFLAAMDTAFRWPSLMSSWGDTSTTTPREGLIQTRRSVVYPPVQEDEANPPVQEDTITPWGEGSSSGWGEGSS